MDKWAIETEESIFGEIVFGMMQSGVLECEEQLVMIVVPHPGFVACGAVDTGIWVADLAHDPAMATAELVLQNLRKRKRTTELPRRSIDETRCSASCRERRAFPKWL